MLRATMNLRGVCVGALALLVASGCDSDAAVSPVTPAQAGDGGEGSVSEGSAGAAGDLSSPLSGGGGGGGDGDAMSVQRVTLELEPSGGELVLDDVTVTIPAGALEETTELTLARVGSHVAGYELYSNVFELSPRAVVFAKPVQVSLAHEGEPALANLFSNRPGAPGYFWVSTTSDESSASGFIAGGGRFFVADGTNYADAPAASCTRVDAVDGVFSSGRSINLLVRAGDCQGRPLAGLSEQDFVGLVDGEPIEPAGVAVRAPAPVAPFVTLLVDVTALASARSETVEALGTIATELAASRARIGLSLYGDDQAVTELLAPSLDARAVGAAIDGLSDYDVPEPPSRTAFAALRSVTIAQSEQRASFRDRSLGGALGEGLVLWLTASESDEAAEAQASALASIVATGATVIAVPLGVNARLPATIAAFAAPDPAALSRAASAAAQRVNAWLGASYWLGYCSGSTSGLHVAGARLSSAAFQLGRAFPFDATGSLPACDPASPLDACEERDCGGPGCGACDDATEQCDPATSKCLSFCESQRWCGGQPHLNPNGYEQTCEDVLTATLCGDACVDLQTDSAHCGACEHACPTGARCSDGECQCAPGYSLCEGECVDTALSSRHCGQCDQACEAGEGCFSGKCASACPPSIHGPALVKIPTPAGGIMCIDATEVTVGQYSEFTTARGSDVSGQRPECGWNLHFEPPEGCIRYVYDRPEPLKHPQECVDWCDAAAYCEWAGKRLCGGIDARSVAKADLSDAHKDAWYNACSSGGVNNYPFGNTCSAMPCVLGGLWTTQVPAGYDCQPGGEYAGVWDLIGNVKEWEDNCQPFSGGQGDGKYDTCDVRGSGYGGASISGGCAAWDQYGNAQCSSIPSLGSPRSLAQTAVGFRCCGR